MCLSLAVLWSTERSEMGAEKEKLVFLSDAHSLFYSWKRVSEDANTLCIARAVVKGRVRETRLYSSRALYI